MTHVAVKLSLRPEIRIYTFPNKNFEYSYLKVFQGFVSGLKYGS